MENLFNELSQYKELFKAELLEDILPYWINYSVEKKGDGFYGAVDMDGNPIESANKSCVLNARILWTFSEAAIKFPNKDYNMMADRAYIVLKNYFSDKQYGGYFMELKPDKEVASDIKHTYAQAFVIYALCKYYEFSRNEKVMEVIKSFFIYLKNMQRIRRI